MYTILEVVGCERLIATVEKNDGEAVQVYSFIEEIFGILEKGTQAYWPWM
jgi:hypothetical protein